MKQLKLTNSELVVTVDQEDFEWAQSYNWELVQKKNGTSIGRQSSTRRARKTALIREIGRRLFGDEFFDGTAYVYHQNRNPFDCRRSNLYLKKFFGKLNADTERTESCGDFSENPDE